MSRIRKRRTSYSKWFDNITVEHTALFNEMVSALNKNHRYELFSKLQDLLSDAAKNEVTFTNYTVTLVARRIVELFCQEWYHSVPLVFIEAEGRTLVIDWRYPISK